MILTKGKSGGLPQFLISNKNRVKILENIISDEIGLIRNFGLLRRD